MNHMLYGAVAIAVQTDQHNTGGPVEEDHYSGKSGLNYGTLERRRTIASPGDAVVKGSSAAPFNKPGAVRPAGVWAERNNREDILVPCGTGKSSRLEGRDDGSPICYGPKG